MKAISSKKRAEWCRGGQGYKHDSVTPLTPGLGALGDLWTACCETSDSVSYRDVVQTVRVATRTPNKPGVSLG